MNRTVAVSVSLILAGCVGTNTVRTSVDTALVQVRAAPICGGSGAANVAQKQAAIETLKAGYDRYIILGGQSENTVRANQMPGTYQTTGHIYGNMVTANTTYTPGPVVFSGAHSQQFAIKMFKESDPNAQFALSARDALGPKWPEMVKAGEIRVCGQ